MLKRLIESIPVLTTVVLCIVRWYLAIRYQQSANWIQSFHLVRKETGLSRAGLLKLLWDFVRLVEDIPRGFVLLAALYPNGKPSSLIAAWRSYVNGDVLQEKIRVAWSKDTRPSAKEEALMVEFLGNCPNYAMRNLRTWSRPYDGHIIRRERVFRLLGAAKGNGRLLDIGCSVNPWSEKYNRMGLSCIGLDLSHISLRIAGLLHPQDRGHLVCAMNEALPFANDSFDRAVVSEVLEHVAAPEAAVAEISRILMPGGIAVVTVPMHVTDAQSLPLDQRRHLLGDATHRAEFFSLSELCHLFEHTGLIVEETISDPYHTLRLRKRKGQVLPAT